MNERHQDCELLRAFVRQHDQAAFATVARRHLDLVYATALRKLEDPGAAEEVAQNVFAALARKAWQFGPDDSLPAWLHRTTLLEAKMWLRGELRRRRREQAAAELGTTMSTSNEQPALRALVPLLDEALLSLREKERTALLLRYYESQSLRDVGVSLGVSEDAARKRVGAALDSLSGFFQRHGFKTATTAAAAAALQHTATAAPATLAAAIAQTTMQALPAGFATLAALLSRLASLTKAQVAALCLVLAVAPISWQWLQAQRTPEAPPPRSESPHPGGALSQAIPAPARDHEPASEEDSLKARLFGLLTAADYRWPEDLDFVRIPKSVVKAFNPVRAIDRLGHPGQIRDWGVELLGLTPEEKQQTEEVLRAHARAFGELAVSQAYETNSRMDELTEWASPPHKSVWVPPLGADLQTLMADLRGQLRQVLGEERAQLLLGEAAEDQPCFTHCFWTWGDLLKGKGVLLTLVVDPDHPQGLGFDELVNNGGGGLYYQNGQEVSVTLPEAITSRFFDAWLAQMGITNSASGARPRRTVTSATHTRTLAGKSTGITNTASAAKPTPPVTSAADTVTLASSLILRAPPPAIQSFSSSGATLTIRGTNGVSDWQYVVLASTNLTLPLAQWRPVVTNAVGVNGDFKASIALTNTLAPTAPQQFFILSFCAPPTMAAPRFNPAAAASATSLAAQVEAKRTGLSNAAAARPGTAPALARRSSLAWRRPAPAELRQRLGIRWDNSPDYILVSKGALNYSGRGPFESEHSGPLIPATCAVLGLTPAERATAEAVFHRAEAQHAAWVKTAFLRVEPAGDIVANYWIPANPELAQQIEAEETALLSEALGPDRAELAKGWSNAWWFRHGTLGRDNFRFTVSRHTDGRSQPLWYALVVPENQARATQDGDVTSKTPFPELLRSVFPGGWRDLAQREGFALPN